MTKPKFTIVTATAGADRSAECFDSWHRRRALDGCGGVVVGQAHNTHYDFSLATEHDTMLGVSVPDYLGPVPAFALGVRLALEITAPDGVIACLHDDLLIEEDGWDAEILAFFDRHRECGLLGFGGGTGLGSDDIYDAPYDPMQLARQDFVSNMRDAETHGRRSTTPVQVACLDGFSQIGRVGFWKGDDFPGGVRKLRGIRPVLTELEALGIVHHAYDSALGALANVRGWQVWMLPIACHHYGGQTAVADAGYQAWAQNLVDDRGGDQILWQRAHRKVYDLLRGALPLRISLP